MAIVQNLCEVVQEEKKFLILLKQIIKNNSQILFSFLPFLSFVVSYSQQSEIKGLVLDSLSKPLQNVIVILSNTKETKTLAHTTTNDDGVFKLVYPTAKNNIFLLSFKHLSYNSKKIYYNSSKKSLPPVELQYKENLLNEVIVQAKKNLEIKGDTISYRVKGLVKKKDYTVEEAIKRIPGIKIAENGLISYNNKAISHLYLNGLDLLEGRYNIATRGIPHEAVEEINILKRHNHARIDDGRKKSDKVAINLKLKNNNNLLFGTAKFDIGISPLIGKLEGTPIIIRNNFQNISSVKLNNSGKSLENESANLTNEEHSFTSIIREPNIIKPPNTNGVVISNKYWLNNRSLSTSNDALVKLDDNFVLKLGANYNKNNNQIQEKSVQNYLFKNNNSIINSITKNRLNKNKYYIGIVEELNKKEIYIKNKTTFGGENSNGFSLIDQNNTYLKSLYEDRTDLVKNSTLFKTKLNNQILNNGLYFNYLSHNENIVVNPSVSNIKIFNHVDYDKTKQSINTKQFLLGGFSSYEFNLGKIASKFEQKLEYTKESLTSNLSQYKDNNEYDFNFPFTSDFRLSTLKSTSTIYNKIEINNFTFNFTPKLNYLYIDKNELLYTKNNIKRGYLFFNPSTSISYKINHLWSCFSSANYVIRNSSFSNLYNGMTLVNHRNYRRNPSQINFNRSVTGMFNISYANVLNGIFFSNMTNIRRSKSDFINSNKVDKNGLIVIKAIKTPNRNSTFRNSSTFSKTFFNILTADFRYDYSKFSYSQIFNDIYQKNKSIQHSFNIETTLDNNTWYTLKYQGNYKFNNIKSDDIETSNYFQKHYLELDLYTSSKTRFNLASESIFTKFYSGKKSNKNTLFNASFYYKPSKKIFFRAQLVNIFNQKYFSSIYNNLNLISEYEFTLRPRQLTIGLNFTF